MENVTKAAIKKALIEKGYSAEVAEKGLQKSARWQRAAYGEVNWQELEDETGDAIGSVEMYCEEVIEKPNGLGTINRQIIKRG
jgi:hypothetical protein